MPFEKFIWNQSVSSACRGGAISLGNFDGVHRGHARLVQSTREQARQLGGPTVIISFDPHPLQLLRPEAFETVMTTVEERASLLRAAGADHVLILQTTSDLLSLSPEAFYREVIHERLGARAVIEGANFCFGHERAGTIETLQSLCVAYGAHCVVVPAVMQDGEPVSSSRVRRALLQGAMTEAIDLLGHPYRIHGVVGTGRQRGRTIGYPTANLESIPTLIPAHGVYAVRVEYPGGIHGGAANIGPNPTFDEHLRKVEVHLIDFQGDLYGARLAVEFLARLRDTRPFSGVEELRHQLHRDIAAARQIAVGR